MGGGGEIYWNFVWCGVVRWSVLLWSVLLWYVHGVGQSFPVQSSIVCSVAYYTEDALGEEGDGGGEGSQCGGSRQDW